MKEIQLSRGHVAIVDDDDFGSLAVFNWYATSDVQTHYAVRNIDAGTRRTRTTRKMHREIMGAPAGMDVDHLNGNGLDNRRSNLRVCTRMQNSHNRRAKTEGKFASDHRGVHWDKSRGKWAAQISVAGVRTFLGRFTEELDAALAYKSAAEKHFGEFIGQLHFMDDRS